MKKLFVIATLFWGVAAIGFWYWHDNGGPAVRFRAVTVRRGDVRAAVSATGTIEPEEVVDVGAQVVGEVISFGPDPLDATRTVSYGTRVEKGTLLARLDDSLFKARLDQASADVRKADADVDQSQAKMKQAEREMDRSRRLLNKGPGMIAPQDAENAQSAYEVARAGVAVSEGSAAVARAHLEEATANLGYTTIRSPVKGVILDRRVNIGQTVVASLNAPSLFLIAKDLSRMEIWASVNETDIGSIHVGQAVHFTVGAFPGETFQGKVAQIRLNASMVQNVVTYTVAVSFENPKGKLLPYLTARVEFEVETHKSVLLVPKAALRWQPKVEHVIPSEREEYARTLKARVREPGNTAGATGPAATTWIWVVSGEFVRPVPVKVGLSDGVSTEVSGEGLDDGSRAVVGVDRVEETDISSFLPHTRTTSEKPTEREPEADTGRSKP
jgi:HlyD family secretion protein